MLGKFRQSKPASRVHGNHLKMMAICCGLPLIGLMAIFALDPDLPSLETALVLLCPVAMIGMMSLLHRGGQADDRPPTSDGTAATADTATEPSRPVDGIDVGREPK